MIFKKGKASEKAFVLKKSGWW